MRFLKDVRFATQKTLQRRTGLAVAPQRFFWKNEQVANEGSIARDILAAERTFLAWARTGLGFVGGGSALAAAYHRQEGHDPRGTAPTSAAIMPAAALLIGNGTFLLLFATRRYYTVLEALRRNKFLINTYDTLLAVAFTSVNTVASLVIVWRAEFFDEKAPSSPVQSSGDDNPSKEGS